MVKMMERFERLQMVISDEGGSAENLSYPQSSRKKKNKMRNKKRFTDEQIKSLESIFESETKLEPRKKLQIARDLGLQPRQVAIWFQNKRARWKSKQIEHEYRELRASYDNLSSQFESLKKEKQSLLLQVEKLNGLLGKQNKDCIFSSSPRSNNSWDKEHNNMEKKPEGVSSCMQMVVSEKEQLDDQVVENGAPHTQAVQEEGWGFPSCGEFQAVAGPSTLPQKTNYGFDSGGLFEQTCGMSHWLNFWT